MSFKAKFKQQFKNSPFIFNFLVGLIYLYIRLAYLTIRWDIRFPEGMTVDDYKQYHGALFAVWHNRLSYAIKFFAPFPPIKALASPHSDGKIIGKIVNLFGFEIVEGSTFRGATTAIRAILGELKSGCNIVITPDGPRGPVGEINSAMVKIASKYDKPLIAASVEVNRSFRLKSWDRMMIPKLFSKVTVNFSKPLELTGNEEQDKETLKKAMGSYE